MILFFTISFIAGVLTVLAPCILPLLPVIIGGSVSGGSKHRAYTVIISLIVSIVLFTLLIKVSSLFLNVSPDTWKYISGGILGILGFSMVFPTVWERLPFVQTLSLSSNKLLGEGMMKKTYIGDIIMGTALGPVFSTCSPTYFVILATVLPSHFLLGLVYLFAYSIGLGLSLLAISLFGQKLANKLAFISDSRGVFKRSIGIIFVLVALAIVTGFDKVIEADLLKGGYFDVTKIEQKLLQATNDMNGEKGNTTTNTLSGEGNLVSEGRYHEITDPAGFINTDGKPIKLSDYVGKKIILIDFLTYSCINCQRTFPYLVDWNTKYADKGLLIVGIHTPEFAFEKVQANVEQAMKEWGITFPIVLDNTYGTWNAYKNEYWPRKYIIDLNGNIVYDHIGEGNYEETEQVIQQLLKTIPGNTIDVSTKKDDMSLMPSRGISSETYLGYGRLSYYGGKFNSSCIGAPCTFTTPTMLPENTFSFGGDWTVQEGYAIGSVGSSITYNANAKKVYFVAGPQDSSVPVQAEVYVDGIKTKNFTIDHSDLYTLVDGTEKKNQTVMVKIISGKVLGYTFTFG